MSNDPLSPEPLSTYEENKAGTENAEKSCQSSEESSYTVPSLDVAGAFTKIDLEGQQKQRDTPKIQYNLTPIGYQYAEIKSRDFDFKERQIKYREGIMESLQGKARDDFDVARSGNENDLEL